ncbi:hypothetical protein F5884DRAFT_850611 [Xylogone sp. PMI_703]|nr:hypothetical protein F5884DRAFT_850611 [Xylogone sp. PMI_703]
MESNCPPSIAILSDPSESFRQPGSAHTTTKRPSSKFQSVAQDAGHNAKFGTITPLEYAEAIIFHSKQTIRDTLHPGSEFVDLALYLKNGTPSLSELEDKDDFESLRKPYAILHTIDEAAEHNLYTYSDPSECTEKLDEGKNSAKCQILFLQGYPSPRWIASIGAFCLTDPEYFNAHLRFLFRKKHYSAPSLRSGRENIITLRFVTLGSREHRSKVNLSDNFDQCRVDALRMDGEAAMDKYERDLRFGYSLKEGDSIVRSFSILDEKNFFIEQEISICLHKYEQGWVVLVSMDAGNDLSSGPPGPWLRKEDHHRLWTTFTPTIQHSSKILLRSNSTKAAAFDNAQGKFPQSAQLLAQHCGKDLDTSTMILDPFYAITNLFQFCAFSEVQFINILEAKIKEDTDHGSLKKQNPTLSNLLYYRDIIQKHLTHLQETVNVIKSPGGHLWPHVGEDHQRQFKKASRARESLLRDYEDLVNRAETLLERCSKGMDVIMSNVMLAESRRSMAQAQAVAKLTLIAFFFIPLSFTSSLFSMNIAGFMQQIGQIWLWFAVSAPVCLISISFLVLDRQKLRVMWSSLKEYSKKFDQAV